MRMSASVLWFAEVYRSAARRKCRTASSDRLVRTSVSARYTWPSAVSSAFTARSYRAAAFTNSPSLYISSARYT